MHQQCRWFWLVNIGKIFHNYMLVCENKIGYCRGSIMNECQNFDKYSNIIMKLFHNWYLLILQIYRYRYYCYTVLRLDERCCSKNFRSLDIINELSIIRKGNIIVNMLSVHFLAFWGVQQFFCSFLKWNPIAMKSWN